MYLLVYDFINCLFELPTKSRECTRPNHVDVGRGSIIIHLMNHNVVKNRWEISKQNPIEADN